MRSKSILAAVIVCMAIFTATSHADNTGARPVQSAVREYINANMPWPPGTVRVDFLSEEPEAIPLSRNVSLRIEPAGTSDFIGDMPFLVRFFRGGTLLRTETIRVRIEVARDVVIAAKPLSSGTILTDSDVRTIRKWLHRIHPQAIGSPEEALGRRLTIRAPAGTEIFTSMLKEAPLVKKGKIVKMVLDNGPMHIITVGLPEEDGIAGSIIRVRNITSNKIIYARVLSDSLVGIEY